MLDLEPLRVGDTDWRKVMTACAPGSLQESDLLRSVVAESKMPAGINLRPSEAL
jgi:hypothetical protein